MEIGQQYMMVTYHLLARHTHEGVKEMIVCFYNKDMKLSENQQSNTQR